MKKSKHLFLSNKKVWQAFQPKHSNIQLAFEQKCKRKQWRQSLSSHQMKPRNHFFLQGCKLTDLRMPKQTRYLQAKFLEVYQVKKF